MRAARRGAEDGLCAGHRRRAVRQGSLAARADACRRTSSAAVDASATPAATAATTGRSRRSRTTTGRPILANDPHRAHGAPSLRYIATSYAPGLDVIGAGEPSLPGISIGHNGTIAFGLTLFYIDQEDLYVYELNPRGPGRSTATRAAGSR